jgi:hypothetical protein
MSGEATGLTTVGKRGALNGISAALKAAGRKPSQSKKDAADKAVAAYMKTQKRRGIAVKVTAQGVTVTGYNPAADKTGSGARAIVGAASGKGGGAAFAVSRKVLAAANARVQAGKVGAKKFSAKKVAKKAAKKAAVKKVAAKKTVAKGKVKRK